MLLLPPDSDNDGGEHEHEHAGELHDGGDVHRAESVAGGDRVGDFVQGSTGGDTQLVLGHAGQRAERDLQQREHSTHNGYDGHGHGHVVVLLVLLVLRHLDGTGQTHDGGRTADAGATGGQDGEHRVDTELAGDGIAHDDGQRDDHSGDRQTLDALREQHGEVELETEQDDAEAQQLVGNQASGVLDACLAAIIGTDVGTADRELDDHTDEQRDDKRAEQAESGELLEPGGEQRSQQSQNANEQHVNGGNALPPFCTELSHGVY